MWGPDSAFPLSCLLKLEDNKLAHHKVFKTVTKRRKESTMCANKVTNQLSGVIEDGENSDDGGKLDASEIDFATEKAEDMSAEIKKGILKEIDDLKSTAVA